jgi:hypothetical protein
MSPSYADPERELETIVLTQLRDSMALVNASMTKMNDKLDSVRDEVTQLASAKYDQQIERLEEQYKDDLRRVESGLQRQIDTAVEALGKNASRLGEQSVAIARLGLGMAIASTVGGTALGSVIVLIITRTLGHV